MTKFHRIIAGGIAATMLLSAGSAASASSNATVLLVWRVPAPLATTTDVQPVEAGLVAINVLAPQLGALRRHPGAKLTLALDPVFVSALERAAQGGGALAPLAAGSLHADDPRAAELLQAILSNVVPVTALQGSVAGKRFLADASAARLATMGNTAASFSRADDVDFAANALLLTLLGSGYADMERPLLSKSGLSSSDLAEIGRASCRERV